MVLYEIFIFPLGQAFGVLLPHTLMPLSLAVLRLTPPSIMCFDCFLAYTQAFSETRFNMFPLERNAHVVKEEGIIAKLLSAQGYVDFFLSKLNP